MKTILPLFLLCLTLLPAAFVQAASAEGQGFLPPSERNADRDDRGDRGDSRDADRDSSISRDRASEIARQYAPGRVLNIRPDGQNWRVRVDQEGSVSDVLVDAESGRVSRENGN